MALTPASILADYSSGIGTQGATLQIKTDDQRVGIGTTNPQGTLQVGTAITMGSGIVTATSFDANTASFSGNVSVGGTLTYEDVTNVDSVGIVTARSDVIVGGGLSVTGISTFNGITTSTTTLFANNFSVSGVSTLGGNVIVGGATTELVVTGDARVTGILTVGTASLTLNGTTGAITGGSLTDAQVAAISTEIVGTGTTADIFVYDTSKDSDGGAWRKRTQHTSWYNETLNTATRGSRREFPSVAVIVTEIDRVTIYDGDDPDLPMWMVFLSGPDNANERLLRYADNFSSEMLNAILCVGTNDTLAYISFIDEYHNLYHSSSEYYFPARTGIVDRNVIIAEPTQRSGADGLSSNQCRDVAMTVLPNAPIDPSTGLPVPTIAVATDDGVSVIKDDGTVVDGFTSITIQTGFIGIDEKSNKILYAADNTTKYKWIYQFDIPSSDNTGNSYLISPNSIITDYNHNADFASYSAIPLDSASDGQVDAVSFEPNKISVGTDNKLAIVHFDEDGKYDTQKGLMCGITTNYNTGWQNWDIKGAFLSDTDTTNVTGTTTYSDSFDNNDNGWSFADNGSSGISGGVMTIEQNSSARATDGTALSGVASGTKLSVTFTISTGGTGNLVLDDDGAGAGAGGNTTIITATSTGTFSAIYTKTTSDRLRFIRDSGSGNYTISEITIKPIQEEDRSVNNKGLAVYGTVTKSAVATGADLVAYSGFSASNALVQPYNSDMNPGTGDYSVMFWFKTTATTTEEAYFRRLSTSGGCMIRMITTSSLIQLYLRDASTAYVTNSTQALDDGVWHYVVGTRQGSTMKLYIDGVLDSSATTSAISHDSTTNDRLIIGAEFTGTEGTFQNPADASTMALFRYSLSAPSPEQIKKIYEDEKVLFQENAACTLYGSSDAVTALAYDEDTNLLHVGTSSGRSDFQGLRRINNTTTAVTTAISASNGLVAEE